MCMTKKIKTVRRLPASCAGSPWYKAANATVRMSLRSISTCKIVQAERRGGGAGRERERGEGGQRDGGGRASERAGGWRSGKKSGRWRCTKGGRWTEIEGGEMGGEQEGR